MPCLIYLGSWLSGVLWGLFGSFTQKNSIHMTPVNITRHHLILPDITETRRKEEAMGEGETTNKEAKRNECID